MHRHDRAFHARNSLADRCNRIAFSFDQAGDEGFVGIGREACSHSFRQAFGKGHTLQSSPIAAGQHGRHLAEQPLFGGRAQQDAASRMERIEVALANRPGQFEHRTERGSRTQCTRAGSRHTMAALLQPSGKGLDERFSYA